jgi:hypothetical protein
MDETKHLSSRLTTLKIIEKDLIPEGVVIDQKAGNSFHILVLNDDNIFNDIDKEVSEIENIIDIMDEPTRKMRQLYPHEFYIASQEFRYLRVHFEFPYRYAFSIMLQVLLQRTSTMVHSENSSQILYTRIVKLMIKLSQQIFDMKDSTDILDSFMSNLEKLESSSSVGGYAKKYGINIKLRNNLRTTIENFKKRFLN